MTTSGERGLEMAARHYADMSDVYNSETTDDGRAQVSPHYKLAFRSLRMWMAKRMREMRKEKLQ